MFKNAPNRSVALDFNEASIKLWCPRPFYEVQLLPYHSHQHLHHCLQCPVLTFLTFCMLAWWQTKSPPGSRIKAPYQIFRPFPNCRIVLDCTEVAVCSTESLDTQSHLYCHYKGCTTLKTLIGVAPNGVITFASDRYGGSTSDKAINADCGVLQQLEAGDMVMADKGFTIRDILPAGVSLNIPTFLGQFTMEVVNHNRLIASARVHVERSIQRLKTFHILSFIPYQHKKHVNKILKVCVTHMKHLVTKPIYVV